jgi:GDPmannose 4,6-dehydratase
MRTELRENHLGRITLKRALITGVTGQDGSYLAEFLLGMDYEVFGMVRRTSSLGRGRIDHLTQNPELRERFHLIYGDLGDASSLAKIIRTIKPDEVYNLGAQSHVRVSFDIPEYSADSVFMGTIRLLEALREAGWEARFYQASSSEMYGKVVETPQKETTPFHPRSPYAVAKAAAHHITVNYRESYGMFNCSGILFNHESPRRGENFVTRKITRAAAEIKLGRRDRLALGNLEAKRDWGFAGDYVKAMWLMLQHGTPDDYVIATGETHSVREFLEETFHYLDLDWNDYVETDPRFFRPAEVDLLLGDASKARSVLNWKPEVDFRGLVRMMVDADLAAIRANG